MCELFIVWAVILSSQPVMLDWVGPYFLAVGEGQTISQAKRKKALTLKLHLTFGNRMGKKNAID